MLSNHLLRGRCSKEATGERDGGAVKKGEMKESTLLDTPVTSCALYHAGSSKELIAPAADCNISDI